jgi:HK97 family phage portal protein
MGLWSWLSGAESNREVRHTDTDPSAYPIEWQLDAVVWHQNHGPLSAEAVPAVYAAIDLIASSIAGLDTDPETPLTRRPDPFDTRFEFLFETVWSLCWEGDAYWLIAPTERGVDSLRVLPPGDVAVAWEDTYGRDVRKYAWLGKEVPADRIRHLRFHPRPGQLEGLSPIEAAWQTWQGAAASESWGSGLFGSSGVPSGVLEAPTALTKEESEHLQAQWTAARNGARNTAVLSGGIKYTPVELSPADIEWLETRASTAQEVARIFQIPPDLLGISVQGGGGSITYKNLAEVGADFVQYCLTTYLNIIEEAWATLPGQPVIEFDTSPLFKESLETRARTFQLLATAGMPVDQAAAETGFTTEEVPIATP